MGRRGKVGKGRVSICSDVRMLELRNEVRVVSVRCVREDFEGMLV